jgi:hypothetical protein
MVVGCAHGVAVRILPLSRRTTLLIFHEEKVLRHCMEVEQVSSLTDGVRQVAPARPYPQGGTAIVTLINQPTHAERIALTPFYPRN